MKMKTIAEIHADLIADKSVRLAITDWLSQVYRVPEESEHSNREYPITRPYTKVGELYKMRGNMAYTQFDTLDHRQLRWYIPLDNYTKRRLGLELSTLQPQKYLFRENELESTIYIENPDKDKFEQFANDYIIEFLSLQKVGNTHEPAIKTLPVGTKNALEEWNKGHNYNLFVGYKKICKLIGLDDNEWSHMKIDNFLKPYAQFTTHRVEFLGMNDNDVPAFRAKGSKDPKGQFGLSGLRRLFPYTPEHTLYDWFNLPWQDWKVRQKMKQTTIEDLSSHIKEVTPQGYVDWEGITHPSAKAFVASLRKAGNVIPKKVEALVASTYPRPTIPEYVFNRYEIEVFSKNQCYLTDTKEDMPVKTIVGSRNQLAKILKISTPQVNQVWKIAMDRMGK